MSYSKLIHEYLDGGVDSTQEALLFDMLAKDSELRADFNKQMKLHLIAQQDMNHITPPAEATNQLFGRLGFTVPDYLETPPPSIAEKVGGYIKKYGATALLILLTSALSVVMTTNYDSWFGSQSSVAQNSSELNSVPVVSSFETDVQTSSSVETTETASNNLKNTTNQNSFSDNSTNNQANYNNQHNIANRFDSESLQETNPSEDGNSETDNSDLTTSFFDKLAAFFTSQTPVASSGNGEMADKFLNENGNMQKPQIAFNPFSSTIILPTFSDGEETQFEIGFKYLSESSNPDFSHLAVNNQFYDNLIVSGMYHFDSNHALGVELGWERFAQSFVTDYYGQLSELKQYPKRFTAGMMYRFTYTALFGIDFISPYTELFAGGSSLGPISKLNAGIRFSPLNNVSMNLGYEYGILYYSVDNKTYNSEKNGLVYRISYNF